MKTITEKQKKELFEAIKMEQRSLDIAGKTFPKLEKFNLFELVEYAKKENLVQWDADVVGLTAKQIVTLAKWEQLNIASYCNGELFYCNGMTVVNPDDLDDNDPYSLPDGLSMESFKNEFEKLQCLSIEKGGRMKQQKLLKHRKDHRWRAYLYTDRAVFAEYTKDFARTKAFTYRYGDHNVKALIDRLCQEIIDNYGELWIVKYGLPWSGADLEADPPNEIKLYKGAA